MPQPDTPNTYPNLDLSSAVFLGDDALDAIANPEQIGTLEVVLPTDTGIPTWPVESAIGTRHECAEEEDFEGVPYITFDMGGVYKGLRKAYDQQFNTEPRLIVAQVELSRDPNSTTVRYVMPVSTTGHKNKAAASTIEYTAKTVTPGSRSDDRRSLTRSTKRSPRIESNSYFVPGKSAVGVVPLGRTGMVAAYRQGRLGTN